MVRIQNKLKKPDIYDLTLWIRNMTSIGPILEWEAALGYQTFRFNDNTGFSPQFSEACEYLLNKVTNEDLHKMLNKFSMN
ncbi:MAG: hypothetical protein IPG12_03710 [Saprospiraceae bacterium]|nr:hypothetical protein [Saprospiraceae bacterium]